MQELGFKCVACSSPVAIDKLTLALYKTQPFLPPVPPVEASSSLDSLFIPFGWAAGILKALILLVAVILYGVGLLLSVAVVSVSF